MSFANRHLTDNIIQEVRSIISERNGEGLDDDLDILPALNRGQDKACSILAKHHAEPLMKLLDITLVQNQADYDIPEDALEDRIVKMEVNIANRYLEMRRVLPIDFGAFETPATSSIPQAYGVYGRKYRVLPISNAGYPVRMMYLFQPPRLVKHLGRITSVSEGSQSFTIDTLCSTLSTDVLTDEAYLSLIDGQTGQRKGVVRIASFTTPATQQRITIATSTAGARATVDNVAVNTTLVGLNVAMDDYICLAPGTCISILRAPVLNFITSFTAAILQESAFAGQASSKLQDMADGFEADVKSLWAGQQADMRVKSMSGIWSTRRRVSYPYPSTRGG
jgi:hypothetical protein